MQQKVKNYLKKSKEKITVAMPVILFFLFLFYTVMFFFDMRFVMIVSSVTVVFKINYRKYLTWTSRLNTAGLQLLLSLLAFTATLNLPLCILLNMTVPFFLVMLKASRFNPLGYFSGAMTFVFLQMRPVGLDGIAEQTVIMVYALGIFVIVQFLYQRVNQKPQKSRTEEKALRQLSEAVRLRFIEKKKANELEEKVFEMQQSFYKEAYQKRSVYRGMRESGKDKYLFALLLQRAVYFISRFDEDETELDPGEKIYIEQLASYMEDAAVDLKDHKVIDKGKRLLQETQCSEGEVYRFGNSFLRVFLLVIERIQGRTGRPWEKQKHQPFLRRLRSQMTLDAFEMRFALRLSVILTAGFIFSMVSHYEHAYWFVMNAFLLLRPMYEESAYRMKTRFVGTVVGCLIIHLLMPTDTPLLTHLAIASFMVIGMYSEVPGTFIHAVFVTCFALTMATLMLSQPMAIELRILYVAAAVIFVLAVNRFFFPTSLSHQFSYNIESLFHLHHQYLRMVEKCLDKGLDYGEIGDAQMQYHLVYAQLLDYLKKAPDTFDKAFYQKIFLQSWYLISEAEQLLLIIARTQINKEQAQQIHQFIKGNRYALDDIQEMLGLPEEKTARKSMGEDYRRAIDGMPELSDGMLRYSKELSAMYRMVITYRQ